MKAIFILFVLISLSACTALKQRMSEDGSGLSFDSRESDVGYLLAYADYYRSLATAAQKKECRRSVQAYQSERSFLNRMQLAVVYSLPGGCYNLDLAVRLIENMPVDANQPDLERFGGYLLMLLKQQDKMNQEMQAVRENLADQKKKSKELETKLDALKDIEESLTRRRGAE